MPTTLTPSLDVPIVLIAPGLGAAEAVLEDADSSGNCRLRSSRFFSPGTTIDLALASQASERVRVPGRIVGYTIAGQRFVYQVKLKESPASLLAFPQPAAGSAELASSRFDLDYRVLQTWRHATGTMLSTTGLLMRTCQTLIEGLAVEVRFTPPSEVLAEQSQRALTNRLWDRTIRDAAMAMIGRPFKTLDLRGRIVCHRPIAGTIGDYGMEFCDADAGTIAEIDRYCTAMRYATV
jgi:hypothetical protein